MKPKPSYDVIDEGRFSRKALLAIIIIIIIAILAIALSQQCVAVGDHPGGQWIHCRLPGGILIGIAKVG